MASKYRVWATGGSRKIYWPKAMKFIHIMLNHFNPFIYVLLFFKFNFFILIIQLILSHVMAC